MKNFMFLVAMLLMVAGVFSCEKEETSINIPHSIIADSKEFYGKLVSIDDFPQDKLISKEQIDEYKLQNFGIGKDPEKALVPLVFDENKILYTNKRYNEFLSKENVKQTIKWTDLRTFRKVTDLNFATVEYVNVLTNEDETSIFVFDPYRSSFRKTKEELKVQLQSNELTKYSNANWYSKGNIIYARWDVGGVSDIYGHTGGISRSPNASSNNNNYLMRSTEIVEASNRGKSLAGLTVGTSDGVFKRYMTNSRNQMWASSSVYARYSMWYPNMTTAQRNSVAFYMNLQIGEAYNFLSSKNNHTQWYCSKLQWKAYRYALGIDIDSNGGFWVFPNDIVNSNLLVGMSF